MLDSSGMSREDEPRRPRQTLLRSFRVAWDGLIDALRIDRNLRIHAAATVIVAAAGAWCRLGLAEWSVIVLAIGLVWVAELLNTSIEAAVDLASPEHHELARRAKDIASAAVLIAAVTAIVVGAIIFGPRLLGRAAPQAGLDFLQLRGEGIVAEDRLQPARGEWLFEIDPAVAAGELRSLGDLQGSGEPVDPQREHKQARSAVGEAGADSVLSENVQAVQTLQL
jgi:diacylglycerol kinase